MHKDSKPNCATANWSRKEPRKPTIKGRNGGQDQDSTDPLESLPGTRSVLIFGSKNGKNYMYEADVHVAFIHIRSGGTSFGIYEGGKAILGGKVSFAFKGMLPDERAILDITVEGSGDGCVVMLDSVKPANFLLPGVGPVEVSLHPQTIEITKRVFYEPRKK